MNKIPRLIALLGEAPFSPDNRMTLPAVAMLDACPMAMGKIAERNRISTAAVTTAADRLERHGLVVRSTIRDRRQIVLQRTEAGDALLLRIYAILDDPQTDRVLSKLGAPTLPEISPNQTTTP